MTLLAWLAQWALTRLLDTLAQLLLGPALRGELWGERR